MRAAFRLRRAVADARLRDAPNTAFVPLSHMLSSGFFFPHGL
jgi:hypothetical protein